MEKKTRMSIRESQMTKRLKRKKDKKEWIAGMKTWRKVLHYLNNVFKTFIGLGVLATICLSVYVWHKYDPTVSGYIKEGYKVADTISRDDFKALTPTVVYDNQDAVVKEFKERNFEYLSLAEDDALYKNVSDAVTSIEDERYYKHKGFDYYGLGAAVLSSIKSGDLRGASTITQQVVKNTYLTSERSLERKVKEAVIAQELEEKFTKREVVEFYVNQNYYSQGQYGLSAASKYYYGKATKDLTVGQLAMLIGIPNSPTAFDPVVNPKNAKWRRNIILAKMNELGKITDEQYKVEKNKELELVITPSNIDNGVQGDDLEYAIHNAVETLMKENGFTFDYAFANDEERAQYKTEYQNVYAQMREKLLRGGYEIHTSINSALQQQLQSVVDNTMNDFTSVDEKTGIASKQASSTVIDNNTGEVVAIVGGRSNENDQFNRAYQMYRQPGSSIKPFVAYTPAIENGYGTNSQVVDEKIANGPNNWYSGFRGEMKLNVALQLSVNTVAYNLVKENGVPASLKKLEKMQFNGLTAQDYTSPIIGIGGFTYGTNTTEMASAMFTLTNQGYYVSPSNVRSIKETRTDSIIYSRENETGTQVYGDGASYVMLDMMKGVIANGYANKAKFNYTNVAGKTGTTDNYHDFWFVGGTTHYSMAVWEGNDQISEQSASLSYLSQSIFKNMMQPLHSGLADTPFAKPNSVKSTKLGLKYDPTRVKDNKNERKNEELTRKENESADLKNRLSELNYRVKYGYSLEQATEMESKVQTKIDLLSNFDEKTGSIDDVSNEYNSVLELLDGVVRPSEKKALRRKLETALANVEGRFEDAKSEAQKELDKIKEQAKAAELKKLEEERLKEEEKEKKETETSDSKEQSTTESSTESEEKGTETSTSTSESVEVGAQ